MALTHSKNVLVKVCFFSWSCPEIKGKVFKKNLLMLSAMNCCSSLLSKFQYYQKTLMNNLSERSLSVEWLGLMLMISDKGFIRSCNTNLLYLLIFNVNSFKDFEILVFSEFGFSSISFSWSEFSKLILWLNKAKSLDEYVVFCRGKLTLKLNKVKSRS